MISDTKLEKLEEKLKENGIEVAYLYGSHAEGNAREESDLDVGILVKDREEFQNIESLELEVSREIDEDVDLRILNSRDTRFLYNVLRTGELFYSENEELRREFEEETMRKYFDLQPFYREYDRRVRERVTA